MMEQTPHRPFMIMQPLAKEAATAEDTWDAPTSPAEAIASSVPTKDAPKEDSKNSSGPIYCPCLSKEEARKRAPFIFGVSFLYGLLMIGPTPTFCRILWGGGAGLGCLVGVFVGIFHSLLVGRFATNQTGVAMATQKEPTVENIVAVMEAGRSTTPPPPMVPADQCPPLEHNEEEEPKPKFLKLANEEEIAAHKKMTRYYGAIGLLGCLPVLVVLVWQAGPFSLIGFAIGLVLGIMNQHVVIFILTRFRNEKIIWVHKQPLVVQTDAPKTTEEIEMVAEKGGKEDLLCGEA